MQGNGTWAEMGKHLYLKFEILLVSSLTQFLKKGVNVNAC